MLIVSVYPERPTEVEGRRLVGKEVRVTGEAQPTQQSDTRAVTPPQAAPTSGSSEPNGKVTTVEETKLDIQKVSVASVAATGDSCSH
jgi:hypothetical protein